MRDHLPPLLKRLVRETPALARTYLVGGCVRDALLGRPIKDFDLEVYGLSYDQLVHALQRWGRADLVGRSFGVVKLSTPEGTYDFALPRRDSKTGSGHRGFEVTVDPTLTPEIASSRRDFTINAMMYDLGTGQWLDCWGGRADLAARILRHTSPAFVEDPLRVLRGAQFAARFELTPAPETVDLCQQIAGTHDELAVERRREEWLKWATQCVQPSRGLEFLRAAGWLVHYPELAATISVPQDPEWHPEGTVWQHTLHCVDALAKMAEWREADAATRAVLMLAVLLHDVGKATTTRAEWRDQRERIISPGHESESSRMAEIFLARFALPVGYTERIVPLIENHLAHYAVPSARAVRRLANRLQPARIQELGWVMTADASGRPPRPGGVPATVQVLLAKAETLKLQDTAPRPILQGRHLIERGGSPGREMGRLLARAFEAQLDGHFHDLNGALEWWSLQRDTASEPGTSAAPDS